MPGQFTDRELGASIWSSTGDPSKQLSSERRFVLASQIFPGPHSVNWSGDPASLDYPLEVVIDSGELKYLNNYRYITLC